MQLSRSLILEVCLAPHGRAIHFGTKRPIQDVRYSVAIGSKADYAGQDAIDANDLKAKWRVTR
jgi:hypothetical protein